MIAEARKRRIERIFELDGDVYKRQRKYKQRTLSDVEQDYLNAIKAISDKSKKGGKK